MNIQLANRNPSHDGNSLKISITSSIVTLCLRLSPTLDVRTRIHHYHYYVTNFMKMRDTCPFVVSRIFSSTALTAAAITSPAEKRYGWGHKCIRVSRVHFSVKVVGSSYAPLVGWTPAEGRGHERPNGAERWRTRPSARERGGSVQRSVFMRLVSRRVPR